MRESNPPVVVPDPEADPADMLSPDPVPAAADEEPTLSVNTPACTAFRVSI